MTNRVVPVSLGAAISRERESHCCLVLAAPSYYLNSRSMYLMASGVTTSRPLGPEDSILWLTRTLSMAIAQALSPWMSPFELDSRA